MAKRILWVSRHSPFGVVRQIETLKGMYGADCEVVHRDIPNSAMIATEYKRGDYSDLVCVVPLAGLDHICREGLQPLWAEMVESQPADGRAPDLDFRGKRFWFDRYRRVRGVSLELDRPVGSDETYTVGVLRATRHPATPEEVSALERALTGDRTYHVELIESPQSFRDGREILDRMRREGASELLIVAPYSVIDQVVRAGVYPLWAEFADRRFVALHRVVGVKIDFEELPK